MVDKKDKITLYLCDGHACDGRSDKVYCFLNKGECRHTSNKDHALSKKSFDIFPLVKLVPFGKDLLIEEFEGSDILNAMQKRYTQLCNDENTESV